MDEALRAGEQMPVLGPCPFCGHVPARNIVQDSRLVMLVCPSGSDCENSGLRTGYLQADEIQAIAAWNRRVAHSGVNGVRSEFLLHVISLCTNSGSSPAEIERWSEDKWIADLWREAERLLAANPQTIARAAGMQSNAT